MRTAAVGLAIMFVLAGCAAWPTGEASKPSGSPANSQAQASTDANPLKLRPNDCTAAPPTRGTPVHSTVLGFTVTLPPPWAESAENEGQQGLEAAFDIRSGAGPSGADIGVYSWPDTTMSAHQAAIWASTQPGSGTVVATGDCTIGGGHAAFLESTIEMSTFPGVTTRGDGYALWVAHGSTLVYLLIDLPAETSVSGTSVSSPIPGPPVMPQVKSILGSWKWDPH